MKWKINEQLGWHYLLLIIVLIIFFHIYLTEEVATDRRKTNCNLRKNPFAANAGFDYYFIYQMSKIAEVLELSLFSNVFNP